MAIKYITKDDVWSVVGKINHNEINVAKVSGPRLPEDIVYLGLTPGGYKVFLARARGGPRIYVGCRWLKLDAAEKHWKAATRSRISSRCNRAKQMLHLVALAKEIARQKKWIKK